jgi:hypothetical protein
MTSSTWSADDMPVPAAPLPAYALADTAAVCAGGLPGEPLPPADADPCAFLFLSILLPVGVTGRHMYG